MDAPVGSKVSACPGAVAQRPYRQPIGVDAGHHQSLLRDSRGGRVALLEREVGLVPRPAVCRQGHERVLIARLARRSHEHVLVAPRHEISRKELVTEVVVELLP